MAAAYCGYCAATASALLNDLVSCSWTLAVIWSPFGAAAKAADTAAA